MSIANRPIESIVSSAILSKPLSRDAQLVLMQVFLGMWEHDREISEAYARLGCTDEQAEALADILAHLSCDYAAIAPSAVKMAEALTAMMPGFGDVASKRFEAKDRLGLIRPIFDKSGIGERIRAIGKLA